MIQRMFSFINYVRNEFLKKVKRILNQLVIYIVSLKDSAVSKKYFILVPVKYGSEYNSDKRILDVNWFIPAFNPGSGSAGCCPRC